MDQVSFGRPPVGVPDVLVALLGLLLGTAAFVGLGMIMAGRLRAVAAAGFTWEEPVRPPGRRAPRRQPSR